jgi:hypothetical protein
VGHTKGVMSAHFSPDGQKIVTSGDRGSVESQLNEQWHFEFHECTLAVMRVNQIECSAYGQPPPTTVYQRQPPPQSYCTAAAY